MDYHYYREVQSERAINANFAAGQINYKWCCEGNSTFNPHKSYMRLVMKITKADGSKLDRDFGLAPNMFTCDNLFQQLEMRINGVCVSQMNDYVAQCSAIKHRLYDDMDVRESRMSDVNYSRSSLTYRINQVSQDGFKSLNTSGNLSIIDFPDRSGVTVIINDDNNDQERLEITTADPNVIQYTNKAGNLAGSVDLTEIGLKPRDIVELRGFGAAYPDELSTDAIRAEVIEVIADGDGTRIIVDRPLPPIDVTSPDSLINTQKWKIIIVMPESEASQRANEFELIWRPPLGFFDIDDDICGNYKFELTPFPDGTWQRYAVESLDDKLSDDFIVEISAMDLHLWTHVRPSAISGSRSYHYTDIMCKSQNLTTASLACKLFSCHDNNHSLTIAYQDGDSGNNITKSRSKFKLDSDEQNNLVRYYIQKDGITLPDPIPSLLKQEDELGFTENGINKMNQRYYENFQYSGVDLTRKEELCDWFEAGPYFHYKWGKGYKRSNQVNVYSNFSALSLEQSPQLLLFDHYHCSLKINMANGRVTDIQVA